MATASAATPSTITVVGSSVIAYKSRYTKNVNNVKLIKGFNTFSGLKAQNNPVSSLGVPVSSEQAFVKVMCSLKYPSMVGRRSRGGASSARCNAAGEIFQIAAIINGLTLVGVAVGFVLLRIEAAVEEAE
ncbi:hypothetical protein L195_g051547 [Trifolium pratense]|uniref:Cytochrome b6-f complex subunit 7 n=2 Tax=Trifolium pratense TaxID=57577 RepID=A0A2K3K0D2_TRIPR|nr:uncharacterized protein LOC123902369 [Trifolium pratense]PNX59690.1 hypothetical protein L195_g051547 [Trifolium pratense]CAJ2674246.1 unnamed protein product [Trifolium pratense]